MEALAVKYRPKEFNEVCGQESIVKILSKQIELNEFKNCYLLCGPSGCGKTTLARIFANMINKDKGSPIEIDAASNNGVDNVKSIIQSARERSIDSEYKIYIIDECHAISSAGWQAFLKCIEEPPKYTIFIFCTTDPQKVPATIQNRVQRFNLSKIHQDLICKRLMYVCEKEMFTNYQESVEFISKMANGGMRDALALLDKCVGLSKDLNINNVLSALGDFSYDTLFNITNSIVDGDVSNVISIIDDLYNKGNDLKMFIEQYLNFTLDLSKYIIFNSMSTLTIPSSMIDKVKYATGFEGNSKYFNWLVSKLLNIKNTIKYDSNIKTTIEIMLISICEGK